VKKCSDGVEYDEMPFPAAFDLSALTEICKPPVITGLTGERFRDGELLEYSSHLRSANEYSVRS
jgi:hypothetical protein